MHRRLNFILTKQVENVLKVLQIIIRLAKGLSKQGIAAEKLQFIFIVLGLFTVYSYNFMVLQKLRLLLLELLLCLGLQLIILKLNKLVALRLRKHLLFNLSGVSCLDRL